MQSVVSGVTAVTAIAALVYTAQSTTRQLHLTEQGQVTDRAARGSVE
ncbi:hypothetical protein [Amycolatopsis balhimycina]|nr:hypothetical protein [Amycolatopsis balhimycina]